MVRQYPGVFVEEQFGVNRPIELVGTRVGGILGEAPDKTAHVGEARAVNSWSDFERAFVGSASPAKNVLANAVFGWFQNGGGRCYIVNIPGMPVAGDGKTRSGVGLLEERDDVAIVMAPGYSDPASHDAILSHCRKMQDRFCILDGPATVKDIQKLTEVAQVAGEGKKPTGFRPAFVDEGCGAFYWPHLRVKDVLKPRDPTILVPPSGHVGGVFARTDEKRGVHKAPANELIFGALGLSQAVTNDEQELLNPAGVNCIRFFQRGGIRIWGARTVAESSSEWKYVPVRRLFTQVEESIALGTRWVVFEPNDDTLWKNIVRNLNGLLTRVWRSGALFGTTPEEAFFVKCDRETNPQENIDAGIVTILVGMAPVKPAEFIVFKMSQSEAGTTVETEES
ncbi:MAG: phage tail sheath family protein [Planctomycetota bacterium]|jgi:phage tail sheath protein FI